MLEVGLRPTAERQRLGRRGSFSTLALTATRRSRPRNDRSFRSSRLCRKVPSLRLSATGHCREQTAIRCCGPVRRAAGSVVAAGELMMITGIASTGTDGDDHRQQVVLDQRRCATSSPVASGPRPTGRVPTPKSTESVPTCGTARGPVSLTDRHAAAAAQGAKLDGCQQNKHERQGGAESRITFRHHPTQPPER